MLPDRLCHLRRSFGFVVILIGAPILVFIVTALLSINVIGILYGSCDFTYGILSMGIAFILACISLIIILAIALHKYDAHISDAEKTDS